MSKAPPSSPAELLEALERPATDPPTRVDGLCIECLGERPPLVVLHDDPFCSTRCARARYQLAEAGEEEE